MSAHLPYRGPFQSGSVLHVRRSTSLPSRPVLWGQEQQEDQVNPSYSPDP